MKKMGWSLQRPTLRAKERAEGKIQQWKEGTWPEVKKAKSWRAWIVFLDESGISQKPSVRRTWAPRGKTPVLCHNFNWKKLSICSVIGFRWDGTRCRLFFRIVPDSYNDVKLIDLMTAFLDDQRKWLSVVRLPAYAPDMNPVESVWGNIQGKELANL